MVQERALIVSGNVATLVGDGAIAQGEGARAYGAGAAHIEGDVEGSQIATGNNNVLGGRDVQTGGIRARSGTSSSIPRPPTPPRLPWSGRGAATCDCSTSAATCCRCPRSAAGGARRIDAARGVRGARHHGARAADRGRKGAAGAPGGRCGTRKRAP